MDGVDLRSNILSSQIEIHKKFGGVVPEVASRKHLENVHPVIIEALDKAGVAPVDLDAVAVTYGPGLVGALLVGVAAAKAMAYSHRCSLNWCQPLGWTYFSKPFGPTGLTVSFTLLEWFLVST